MTELPFVRRAIKSAALIFISLGFAIHVLTTYTSPLLAILVLAALLVVVVFSLIWLLPRASTQTQARKATRRHPARPQAQS